MINETPEKQNVQATDNSVAVGNISVDGSIGGDLTIGNIGYTAEEVSVLFKEISTHFQPKPFDGRCPYKGLDVFQEKDAELFFGREKLVSELVRRVQESRAVFVTGSSGCGKSSLVRAGLIPALRHGAIKEQHSEEWLYLTMKPGRDPIEALSDAFSRLTQNPEAGNYVRKNATNPDVLHQRAQSILSDDENQRLVLFIDQFEEVFTQLGHDKAEVFLNLLTHATMIENGRVILLFSMRSDFIPNCQAYPKLNTLLGQKYAFAPIGAMQNEELVSAIAQPAQRVGLKIDPALVAQIINDMGGEPGALPLMQFALKDLFEARQSKGGVIELHLRDYLVRGGIHKALERHADSSFNKLNGRERVLARFIFSGLVEIRRDMQFTSRTALLDELLSPNATIQEAQVIVRKLADARLVTTNELKGKTTVIISHEKLITAWTWLRKLVEEEGASIAIRNQIIDDAREWDEHQRHESMLYRGIRLKAALDFLKLNRGKLNLLETSFIRESQALLDRENAEREAQQQRELQNERRLREEQELRTAEAKQSAARLRARNRLLTIFGVAAGFLALAALGFGVFAIGQRNEAKKQTALSESARLAALAQLETNDNRPEVAAQIAMHALQNVSYTKQAEQALTNAVQRYRLVGRLTGVQSARWAPDGKAWAVVSPDNSVAVIDGDTYKDRWRIQLSSSVLLLRWSPTGDRLLVHQKDGTDVILSAADGRVLFTQNDPPREDYFMMVSEWAPDGQSIASSLVGHSYEAGDLIHIWDANSGETLLSLRFNVNELPEEYFSFNSDEVGALDWSPDGDQIVVTHPFGGCCGMISLWDARSGSMLKALPTNPYFYITWSPDGQWVAASGAFHGSPPEVWDVQTWTSTFLPLDAFARAGQVAWSPDGRFLASVGDGGNFSWVWDVNKSSVVLELPGRFDEVEWAPRGYKVLAHEQGQTVASLFSLYPANHLLELQGAQTAAWSPDGSQVLHSSPGAAPAQLDYVAAALEDPGTDPTTVELTFPTDMYGWTNHLAWFADGRLALTYGSSSELWDMNKGIRLDLDESLAQSTVFWSPSGMQYAVASSEGHKVYNAQGQLLYQLPAISQQEELGLEDDFLQITWNLAETQLATTDGKLIRLWDAKSGRSLGELQQLQFPVTSLSWSPDGSRIAAVTGYVLVGASSFTAFGENVVHIYDVASRQEIYRLESPLDGVINVVAWSPNGKYLLTGNSIPEEDTLRIWRVWPNLQDLIDFATSCCQTIELSDEQIKQFGIK